MSKFTTPFILEPSADERTAKLFYPLTYQSDILGAVTIPARFSTDFASVPRVFWNIFPPIGSYGEAAVVHDFLYRTQTTERATADAVFLEAMTATDVPRLTRRTLYAAVRMFGWLAWRENKTHNEKNTSNCSAGLTRGGLPERASN